MSVIIERGSPPVIEPNERPSKPSTNLPSDLEPDDEPEECATGAKRPTPHLAPPKEPLKLNAAEARRRGESYGAGFGRLGSRAAVNDMARAADFRSALARGRMEDAQRGEQEREAAADQHMLRSRWGF